MSVGGLFIPRVYTLIVTMSVCILVCIPTYMSCKYYSMYAVLLSCCPTIWHPYHLISTPSSF